MTINRVSHIAPEEISFLENNPNKGSERGHHHIRKSIEKLKFGRPMLMGRDGGMIAGNQTMEIVQDLGLPIEVVESYGDVAIVHKRLDLSSDDPKAMELAIADNRSSEVGLAWDMDVLDHARSQGLTDDWWFEAELDELDIETAGKGQTKEMEHAIEDLSLNDEPIDLEDDDSVKPGQAFILGHHRLVVGVATRGGDANVMIAAWQRFTGHKAIRDDAFDEFMELTND